MFSANPITPVSTQAQIQTPSQPHPLELNSLSTAPASRAPSVESTSTMESANDKNYMTDINQLGTSTTFFPRLDNVVVAVSSGALFNFSVDHEIQKTEGADAYAQYQMDNESNILEKGDAFNLVEKMYGINEKLEEINSDMRFDVVITSKNTPDACLRAIHSANHYKLPVCRTAFSGGATPYKYAKAFGATLYLTTNPDDAKAAIDAGVPAAHILPSKKGDEQQEQLRIAFDADAVIFSDASEQISMKKGLPDFYENEKNNAHIPMEKGPLYPFLHKLSQIKKEFPRGEAPIRIAVTTARGAPADERLIRTLRSWDIEVDELHLLGGKDKGPFLEAFEADIFFDDKYKNAEHGAKYVVSGHVNYGVSNEK